MLLLFPINSANKQYQHQHHARSNPVFSHSPKRRVIRSSNSAMRMEATPYAQRGSGPPSGRSACLVWLTDNAIMWPWPFEVAAITQTRPTIKDVTNLCGKLVVL